MISMFAIAVGVLAFLAFVVLAVLASLGYSRFVSYLRAKHPATWSRIGGPSMQRSEADESVDSPSANFFWRRQYRDLPDPELHRLGDRARALAIALLWALGALTLIGCLLAIAL